MTRLAYQIPDDGRARRTLRIPESIALHVCPGSCGRRQGIRALRNGIAGDVAFLRLSEADVISGDYIGCVEDAVACLLGDYASCPRAVTIYVNCIDVFLGTDERALLDGLSHAHPETRFMLAHIAPVAAREGESSARSSHARLYEIVDAPPKGAEPDAAVTVTGSFEPVPASSELPRVLAALGAGEIRELCSCTTFDDYQALGRSRLALSLSHLGDEPARMLSKRCGMPAFSWHACYDVNEIGARYRALAGMFGADAVDLAPEREAAIEALDRARRAVGETPVAVDSSATFMPFSLALSLLGAGFQVAAVFALHVKGCDLEAKERLAREHPAVRIVEAQSVEAVLSPGAREWLCVGRDAAFLLRSARVVDIYHDERFFGYDGARLLFDGMTRAMSASGGEG